MSPRIKALTRFRRGFTLVEAMMAALVVAIMFVAALNTVGAARLTQHRTVLVERGRLLVESLLAEILQQEYQEPGTTYVFGREAGESQVSRVAYDDVDDYQGWTAAPPVAKDGTVLLNATNWQRSVTVEWVDPLAPQQVSGTETGAKRITVVAAFRGVPQATVVALRTEH